jgi:hypothetical protein
MGPLVIVSLATDPLRRVAPPVQTSGSVGAAATLVDVLAAVEGDPTVVTLCAVVVVDARLDA